MYKQRRCHGYMKFIYSCFEPWKTIVSTKGRFHSCYRLQCRRNLISGYPILKKVSFCIRKKGAVWYGRNMTVKNEFEILRLCIHSISQANFEEYMKKVQAVMTMNMDKNYFEEIKMGPSQILSSIQFRMRF